MHLTTIYSRCWTSCLVYVFSTPRRTFHRIFTDCEMTHRQGRWNYSAEPSVPARGTALHPWGLEEFCRSLPMLCQKALKASHTIFSNSLYPYSPHWIHFLLNLYPDFPRMLSNLRGIKKKTGEWRKTMVESARRKRRSRRSLSSSCHLLMNKNQTVFVIKGIIIT